jgi:hypothetical protein
MKPIRMYHTPLIIAIVISAILHLIIFGNSHFDAPNNTFNRTIDITFAHNNEATDKTVPKIIEEKEDVIQKNQAHSPQSTDTDITKAKKGTISNQPPADKNLLLESITHDDINAPEAMPPAIDNTPASWVEIKYKIKLKLGNIGYEASLEGTHHLDVSPDGAYHVSFRSPSNDDETANSFQIETQGKILRYTILPSSYFRQGHVASILFKLNDFSTNISKISGRLPDNILDKQSLTYQFMFFPPQQEDRQLFLSDGNIVETYTVKNSGATIFKTSNFGELRIIKIMLQNIRSSEHIEMWLSPDYKYLPLRILHTDINNQTIDQEAIFIEIK